MTLAVCTYGIVPSERRYRSRPAYIGIGLSLGTHVGRMNGAKWDRKAHEVGHGV